MEAVGHALFAGAATALGFFWDSLYGLIFGFLISALAQVAFSRRTLYRYLGPNLRGIVTGAAFGIVASACSYGAAAAGRGLYQKGADARPVFAFMISSTNMNVAIVILFWALLGWKFAFAEVAGGIVIIAVVTIGLTLLLKPADLRGGAATAATRPAKVTECLQCGMEGEEEHAVEYRGSVYLFCGARHEREFRDEPERVLGESDSEDEPSLGLGTLRSRETWRKALDVALGDVVMLRNELIAGYLVAGFAAALIPAQWFASALHTVAAVPYVGYLCLLVVGLLLAVFSFVCSMGNVPIARYLASAGIPLGANTVFIYGDLLIPPLLGIYRKSFPPKLTWSFVGLFIAGALVAGATMDYLIGNAFGGFHEGSMAFSDRLTLVANIVAFAVAIAVVATSRTAPSTESAPG